MTIRELNCICLPPSEGRTSKSLPPGSPEVAARPGYLLFDKSRESERRTVPLKQPRRAGKSVHLWPPVHFKELRRVLSWPLISQQLLEWSEAPELSSPIVAPAVLSFWMRTCSPQTSYTRRAMAGVEPGGLERGGYINQYIQMPLHLGLTRVCRNRQQKMTPLQDGLAKLNCSKGLGASIQPQKIHLPLNNILTRKIFLEHSVAVKMPCTDAKQLSQHTQLWRLRPSGIPSFLCLTAE